MVAAFQKALFRWRHAQPLLWRIRLLWWRAAGMRVGAGTKLPRLEVNWPHQVSFGRDCVVEPDVCIKFDGIWAAGPSVVFEDGCFVGRGCEFNISRGVRIGRGALIASGCKFIDHDHGYKDLAVRIGSQPPLVAPIAVGDEAWLGVNTVVLQGVSIGQGAVIAAGAVVRTAVPDLEIWGGVPARRLGSRADFQ
jgi:acetyltransferase-like isoleucine patch superfamily enzyme